MSHEIDGILLEDEKLSLDELARSCQVSQEWIIERVQCGVLLDEDADKDPSSWIFDSRSFIRTKKILSVERNFECHPELAGLVADMAEEITFLRNRIHRLETDKE